MISSTPSWHYPRVPDTLASSPSLRIPRWTIPCVHACSPTNSVPEQSPSRAQSLSAQLPTSFHPHCHNCADIRPRLAQETFAADFTERGRQQFLLACVILPLPGKVPGSVFLLFHF